LNKEYYSVREFHARFGHPYSDKPVFMARERAAARCSWMREEIQEFLDAPDITEQADAMIDLIYFALGTLAEIGVPPDEIFEIVHTANMAKLWPDGKPRYKPDGKTLKPEGWEDPYPKVRKVIRQLTGRADGPL
jgi:predicted HAD superfamily Cof-like phosphohydrolase